MRSFVNFVFVAGIGSVFFTTVACHSSGGDSAPGLTWVKPEDSGEIYGIARLEVRFEGGGTVTRVSFYVDKEKEDYLIGRVSAPAGPTGMLPWYTTDAKSGPHTLIAVARFAGGSEARASRPVVVANVSRSEAIPPGAVKMRPDLDAHPPQLEPSFQVIFEDPVPLPGPINTAGAEDSPFITPDAQWFYVWFTPDPNVPPEEQVFDRVTGIYQSRRDGDDWTDPERVFLNYFDDPALDGAETVADDTLWFGSIRAGNYREIDMYTARLVEGRWRDWTNAGELLNASFEIGELHVTPDGLAIYFDSSRAGGLGKKDIWVTRFVGGTWQEPENVAAVNTAATDGWPALSATGAELWFTRDDLVAPAIYRSLQVAGAWSEAERVLQPFAGEPTLDAQGNLYFVHHFWDDAADQMIEADIYVCYRK
ncbi:MAG: hypothetical protein AB1486_09260 [Planctomycetota bacterium]